MEITIVSNAVPGVGIVAEDGDESKDK